MMPQFFATLNPSPPEPFALGKGATTTTDVRLAIKATVRWQDGTTEPHIPDGTLIASAYGGTTFDTTTFDWVLLAVLGQPFRVLKELELASPTGVDALLGGTPQWAPLRRITGPSCYPTPQV